ncbi:hypothetical protein OROMI_032275 [Orobanche minor]
MELKLAFLVIIFILASIAKDMKLKAAILVPIFILASTDELDLLSNYVAKVMKLKVTFLGPIFILASIGKTQSQPADYCRGLECVTDDDCGIHKCALCTNSRCDPWYLAYDACRGVECATDDDCASYACDRCVNSRCDRFY